MHIFQKEVLTELLSTTRSKKRILRAMNKQKALSDIWCTKLWQLKKNGRPGFEFSDVEPVPKDK